MMASVNKVILVGNLGKDPEVRYMPSGDAITNISVATTDSWKDKNTGEKQERVEWHKIAFFGKLAEIASEYLKKGSQVYIEGKLQTRKWQDKDGNDRYTTEIVADRMQMLGGRGGDVGDKPTPEQQQNRNAARDIAPNTARAGGRGDRGFDDFEDDIPF